MGKFFEYPTPSGLTAGDEKIVLEPCPFCRAEAEELTSDMFRVTHHPGCWLVQSGHTFNSESILSGAGQINFWNTRAGQ